MPASRHSDPLASFSHRIVQIKFIILELAMLVVFLNWIWDKLAHDIKKPAPAMIERSTLAPSGGP